MRLARIRGYVTATVKHRSLERCRLLIAQPVDLRDQPDGAPQVVLDPHGAGLHQKVLLCSDGSWARDYLEDPKSPARWWVMGIVDENSQPHGGAESPGDQGSPGTPLPGSNAAT